MSLSKESYTSSVGLRASVKFPFEIEPQVTKLTFGHHYAIQGVPMSETITFINTTNDGYRMTTVMSTSPKYTMEVDEEKIDIKKKSRKSVTITICFNTVATVGLTGEVTFQVRKKVLIGREESVLGLRFQMYGVIPKVSSKEIIQITDKPVSISPSPHVEHQQNIERCESLPLKGKLIEDKKLHKEKSAGSYDKEMEVILEKLRTMEDEVKVGEVKGKPVEYKGELAYLFKYDKTIPDMDKTFENVITAYTDIHHPTVVQMVAINFHSNFLLLEADTQHNLEMILEEQLPLKFVLRCCVNLATALQYLSSEKILHRNVKPNKLRLVKKTLNGMTHVKLHDFSCAVRIAPGEVLKEKVGTLEYMSPEILRGEGYGLKSDVYSFAMTMYTLFSGKKPFGGMSVSKIQEFVRAGRRLSPSEKIPIPIIAVINKCWAEDPATRPEYKWIVDTLNDFSRTLV
ncbi:proto-oncogene tyrosine protein kinase FER, putative [Entamoeba invadens IP1]|uniref:Proto-oncogene tyrosine protein kinase FER, putative n=1 Tax=Entamoeba invadens IP1 TaxID=370355 RepID=A0A0A1U934_ENTIV|nr:proto-oncogene tyrosine protein kinase FER, putative [Entamoeba invadens IP1]ELP91394.1 proto-oncogene tyrosine protein kinase FER, putative [Entamoeba invadens IP1]|eukprot:XP_004258165.1 proto-oncogene tyrosine protein kinase FER, putative [Entamoeba invadens IP1]